MARDVVLNITTFDSGGDVINERDLPDRRAALDHAATRVQGAVRGRQVRREHYDLVKRHSVLAEVLSQYNGWCILSVFLTSIFGVAMVAFLLARFR